jgi:hypothetical protein
MAKHHYNADSSRDPPLLPTAAGHFLPPDGTAACMAFGLPSCRAGVSSISITRS